VDGAMAANGGPASDDDLATLLAGKDTWTIDNA
jgi:2-oxoglutarate ferredoxin oxidoreductase subunit beta